MDFIILISNVTGLNTYVVFFLSVVQLGAVTATIAIFKHRNPVGWFLFGAIAFPVALTAALLVHDLETRHCPSCSERMFNGAPYCGSCGRSVRESST